MEINRGAWLEAETGWYNTTLKRIGGNGEAEVKKLLDDGYPTADKYRRKAFEALKKAGSIPDHRKFKEAADEEEDAEVNNAAFSDDEVLCDNSAQTESKLHAKLVFDQYLEGDKVAEVDIPILVSLFLESKSQLESRLEKAGPKKKTALLKSVLASETKIDKGENRVGLGLGWFLSYKEDVLMTIPLVNRIKKGGPAEQQKMQLGDVIESIAGVDVRSFHSRNRVIRLFALWPHGLELPVEVRRIAPGATPGVASASPRLQKEKVKFVLSEQEGE